MTILHQLSGRLPYGRGPALLALFDHGEGALAVEMIIENLHEFDIAVSGSELAVLSGLAEEYALVEEFVSLLGELSVV